MVFLIAEKSISDLTYNMLQMEEKKIKTKKERNEN